MPPKLNHQNAVLRICVDGAEDNRIFGRVYGQRLAAPFSFSDLGGLLLQLEDLLERQDFPQAFQRIRSFAAREERTSTGDLPEDALSAAEVEAAQGALGTFELLILTRRSATWQGSTDWLDGSEGARFSSDLEFLKLVEKRFLTGTM